MGESAAAVVELRSTRSAAGLDLDQYAHGAAVRALDPTGDLGEVIAAVGRAIRHIEARVGAGSLAPDDAGCGATNVQGEIQLPLDVFSNDVILRELLGVRAVAGVVSEELAQPHLLPDADRRGSYLLAVDPLDGSSNVAVNVPVGTIFSVLRRTCRGGEPELAEFLQPGREQVCAGFALYGPATVLVLATAAGVVGFTLDRDRDTFVRTQPALRVPEHAQEFAINVSNERFWPQPVRGFVSDCLAGRAGPRGRDYNMRWIASLVAEAYRILTRGGVFLYPADSRSGTRAGRLRLLYECNPIAFVMEQAGGRASTGRGRVLDVPPTGLHQRISFVFGSAAEVEAVEAYHLGGAPGVGPEFPLFNTRTLFRGR
jgi:fructose-1,6-bisphosphatase I / sedoheptulose-1,7-bisphosphatase